jgi:hypothetical protein
MWDQCAEDRRGNTWCSTLEINIAVPRCGDGSKLSHHRAATPTSHLLGPHHLSDTGDGFSIRQRSRTHTTELWSARCNLTGITYPVAIMQRPFYVAPHFCFISTVRLIAQNIHSATLKDYTILSVVQCRRKECEQVVRAG